MKVVEAEKIDSIADYAIVEKDVPSPGEGQLLIKVMACGMGYVDALVAVGGYQVKPPTPFIPGQEIAGIVEEVGPNVSDFVAGDRVMFNNFGGGLAEFIVAPAQMVTLIPSNMSFGQAAGFRINYVTALHALRDRADLQAGERLLVLGAAGGVGTAAIQIGNILNAEVVAAASTDDKRAFARAQGAQYCIDTDVEGWRDRLKSVSSGKGPDVVFDPVSGPLFEAAFRSLAWRGRHLVIGFAGGPIPRLPINLTLMKGSSLMGVDVRQFLLFEEGLAHRHLTQLLQWVSDGKLTPPIGRRFPLEAFGEAMEFAMSGRGTGKTIIEVAES